MLGCSESIYMVPYRRVLRPGLMVGGAEDILVFSQILSYMPGAIWQNPKTS